MAFRDLFGAAGCAPDGTNPGLSSTSSAQEQRVNNPLGQFVHTVMNARETMDSIEEMRIPQGNDEDVLRKNPSIQMPDHVHDVQSYMNSLKLEDDIDGDVYGIEEGEEALRNFNGDENLDQLGLNFNWDNFWQDFHTPMSQVAQEPPSYQFSQNNPFLRLEDPFTTGMDLFHRGCLDEAILAFEAQIQQGTPDINLSDAWRWLGTSHAENDEDKVAISCLLNSVAADPENLEALLDIGVSYTNELVAVQALNYLRSWLSQHPDYQVIPAEFDKQPEEGFYTLHKKVTAMFRRASEMCPHDADLFAVLGVLYNLSREYDLAIESFKQAIVLDPKNYSLWNKLGATQANSPRPQGSKEAVYAYRKALELKPNYVRAWVNMGISYANQGIYDTASKYYLRALSLNPRAEHVWSYLRIALSCHNREDLVRLVDSPDRDVNLFRSHFEF
eukprot:TRINITY_DN657_c0_g1_i1.p1 TRINITY_DN657_c0_g1~~TRINITY_DN657_c0_g1_i1.p1  ORF type:complete len:462 (-),score=85.73 TRINITY_DN657_c0_g1_i1:44-1375(-)